MEDEVRAMHSSQRISSRSESLRGGPRNDVTSTNQQVFFFLLLSFLRCSQYHGRTVSRYSAMNFKSGEKREVFPCEEKLERLSLPLRSLSTTEEGKGGKTEKGRRREGRSPLFPSSLCMGSKESAIPSPFSYPPPREMCEFGEMDLEVRGREVFWHAWKGEREI